MIKFIELKRTDGTPLLVNIDCIVAVTPVDADSCAINLVSCTGLPQYGSSGIIYVAHSHEAIKNGIGFVNITRPKELPGSFSRQIKKGMECQSENKD